MADIFDNFRAEELVVRMLKRLSPSLKLLRRNLSTNRFVTLISGLEGR